jgi:hypothetical protein
LTCDAIGSFFHKVGDGINSLLEELYTPLKTEDRKIKDIAIDIFRKIAIGGFIFGATMLCSSGALAAMVGLGYLQVAVVSFLTFDLLAPIAGTIITFMAPHLLTGAAVTAVAGAIGLGIAAAASTVVMIGKLV